MQWLLVNLPCHLLAGDVKKSSYTYVVLIEQSEKCEAK